ncbi:hypothetical protein ACFLRQ_03405, partial [Bacteroidota bacterium]
AELNVENPAVIEITKKDGGAAFCSSGTLLLDGKKYEGEIFGSSKLVELDNGKTIFKEATDVLPEIIKEVLQYK